MAQIKQIKVGSTTYDIEPANQAQLSAAILTSVLGYTPANKAGDTFEGNIYVHSAENEFTGAIDVAGNSMHVAGNYGHGSAYAANDLTLYSANNGGQIKIDGDITITSQNDADVTIDGTSIPKNATLATQEWVIDQTAEFTPEMVITALGYTPVNKVGDTMTGSLTITDPSADYKTATYEADGIDATNEPNFFIKASNGSSGIQGYSGGYIMMSGAAGNAYIYSGDAGETQIEHISVPKGTTGKTFALAENVIATSAKGVANGVATLGADAKVPLAQLPDSLVGQLVYGGTVTGAGVATLSNNAKARLGATTATITLSNSAGTKTSETGWVANEGIYYIATSNGTFASLDIKTGDWLISTGSAWKKVDNTDAVTGVKGSAETTYRIGNVNITAENVGALPTTGGALTGMLQFADADTQSIWGSLDAANGNLKLFGDTSVALCPGPSANGKVGMRLRYNSGTSVSSVSVNTYDLENETGYTQTFPLEDGELATKEWVIAQTSEFTPEMVISALGYTPANKAGDTFTGDVTLDAGAKFTMKGPSGVQAVSIATEDRAGGIYAAAKVSIGSGFADEVAIGNTFKITSNRGITGLTNSLDMSISSTSGAVTIQGTTIPSNSVLATADQVATNLKNGTPTGALCQLNDGASFTFVNANSARNGEAVTIGATGQYATSLGGKSKAEGKRAVSEGTQTIAQGNYSHAEGNNTITTGADAHAEGLQTVASNTAAHAEGTLSAAAGNSAHAEGYNTKAMADSSHAEGYENNAYAGGSHAEGSNNTIGENGQTYGDSAHVEGTHNYIGHYVAPTGGGGVPSPSVDPTALKEGDGSHAEGFDNMVSGYGSHAEGSRNVVTGNFAHASGAGNIVARDYQTVVGGFSAQDNNAQFIVGAGTSATARKNAFVVANDNAYVSGGERLAKASEVLSKVAPTATGALSVNRAGSTIGYNSVAIGHNNMSTADASFAAGISSAATANYAVAIGHGAQATAQDAVAIGHNVLARAADAAALGYNVKTNTNSVAGSLYVGRYNTDDATALFAVGMGSGEETRANAFTVHTDGHVTSGEITSPKVSLKSAQSSVINSISTDEYGGFAIKRGDDAAFGIGGGDARLYNRDLLPANNNATASAPRNLGSNANGASWKKVYIAGDNYNLANGLVCGYAPASGSSTIASWIGFDRWGSPLIYGYNGSVDIAGNLRPAPSSGARDLGTSSMLWRNAYLTGDVKDASGNVKYLSASTKVVTDVNLSGSDLTIEYSDGTSKTIALPAGSAAALGGGDIY